MLRALIGASGLNPPDLATKVGIAPSTLAAVLSGERTLTKGQVVTLARFFGISPAAFLPA